LTSLHVATDTEELFILVLRGVDDAIQKVRRGWSASTETNNYTTILETLGQFAEIAAWQCLRKVDLSLIPRTLRSRVLSFLPKLSLLSILSLWPGTQGGWVPIKGPSAIQLATSLSSLTNLVAFTLKKDCTLDILKVLVDACSHVLRLLDVEESRGVGEEAVGMITLCKKLQELNMTGTKISEEGKARVIMGLPKLRHLVRADYLCDALGWIDYLEEVIDPVYDLQEFTPSQSYFFHETWQLEMVARMCPNIKKILFIQHSESCPSLLPLQEFHLLTDLQLHGASWEGGGLQELLDLLGRQLQHLGLISCKGLSVASLRHLLLLCPNLSGFVLNNCTMAENEWARIGEFPIGLAPSLTELVVTSNVASEYITWLCTAAPRLRVLHLGSTTQVRDSTFPELIAKGALSDLEELQIEKSSNLSMVTLDALIGGCKELRSVGDLSQWEGISGPDLGQMRQLAHEQNLQLDLSSHQVLRRFLGLANGDQRAMMTLMTGPIMERIRLTQVAAARQQGPVA